MPGRYGRGGLLPMAVFLTQNAPGLRTSPVKRGYWVVQRRARRERFRRRPPTVPELPQDEAKMDLPLRDMLAKHRENPSVRRVPCALRFVRAGVRRLRPGRREAVEGSGRTAGGHAGGLSRRRSQATDSKACESYIREHRQKDFLDNLSRKLLAYALGRSLLLSDEPLDRPHEEPGCRRTAIALLLGGNDRHQPAVPEQTEPGIP